MKSRWNENEAKIFKSPLEQRVYSSRLLGQDPDLVLHGGGNTSVKDEATNLLGEKEAVLFIKGSGWDLATIEAPGFPGVRLEPLRRLRRLPALSDPNMVNELRSQLLDSGAPNPSVEALLHAFLPHRFVDHTHADAVLCLTNQPDGQAIIKEIFGKKVGIVPYIMPGFALSKLCAEVYESDPSVDGLILMNHGVLSFGETAQQSYERMIQIVEQAERYISSKIKSLKLTQVPTANRVQWMQSIRKVYFAKKFPCVLQLDCSALALEYVNHPNCKSFSQRGPLTPDHVIRTKHLPLFADDKASFAEHLEQYTKNYNAYFKRQCESKKLSPQQLDPLARVILVPKLGVVHVGTTVKAARISKDIYQHTMSTILKAEQLGKYIALDENHLFDMEYWVLEQAKLKKGAKKLPLTGKVALVTGGAGGIGKAIAKKLLNQGAVVAIFDSNAEKLKTTQTELSTFAKSGNTVAPYCVDVTEEIAVADQVNAIVGEFGGLDHLVLNAGIFPPSNKIEDIALEDWQKSLAVNLTGTYLVLAAALRTMKAQAAGGDIVFIASKNVPAPGKGAAAYSVAKAGQSQLARVCAMEAGEAGIRVNTVHPHLIFDTDLWAGDLIKKRAEAYQMTPAQYKTNNLLKTSLCSDDVAEAVFALIGGAFSKTTGAQLPIDGGNERTL